MLIMVSLFYLSPYAGNVCRAFRMRHKNNSEHDQKDKSKIRAVTDRPSAHGRSPHGTL